MTYVKPLIFLALTVALGGCSAATETVDTLANVDDAPVIEADVVKHTKPQHHYATVKPGASVTLNPVLPKSMTSGSFQAVQLQFGEAYSSGTMTVSIEPSAGLSLFGGTSSKTFDMTNPNTHVWDLDVKADADGVYFLNIFAEAEGQPRVFSVRLDMGQVTQKMFEDAMPADGELVDGGKIRVLDATETIK